MENDEDQSSEKLSLCANLKELESSTNKSLTG
jgi:hypothetical protein